MISKNPQDKTGQTCLTHGRVKVLLDEAVKDALAESRAKGVPIPITVGEETHFELPDGTIVTEDPWQGKNTAPEGWYQRFGIEPPK